MDLARNMDDWGLVAELTHYHKSDTHVLNIVAEIHVLNCEMQVIKAACRQSCGCLKGACTHHRL